MIGTGIASQIIYFDICSLIILAIIFYTMISRKLIVGMSNITFTALSGCVLLATIFDIINALYSNKVNFLWSLENFHVRSIFLYGYFIFRNLTLPVYEVYLLVVSGGWSVIKKRKGLIVLFFIPYFILICFLISNLFTHQVFYFDYLGRYTRGPFSIVYYITACLYIIVGFIILFYYRKIFPHDKFVSLCTMIPLNIIAVCIQFLMPQILVECFCTTSTVLLVTFTVQRPEENLDRLGAFSVYAFKEDIQKFLTLKNNLSVVIVGLKNYDVIKSILTQQDFNTFMINFSESLKKMKKKYSYFGDIYHFDNGIFTILSIKENKREALALAENIENSFSNGIKIGKVNLNIEPSICVVECPNDFSDYDSLASFINRYQNFFSDIKGVIDLETHSEHINYRIKTELNDIISRGIKSHGFMVYYQPIYSTEKKKFVSAEALIRLNDPKWGFVSPELFIPAAEKNGTILHIGKVVFEEVCKFISSPVFSSLDLEYIEINLSVAQCLQTDLVDVISELLKKYDVKPNQINLEITERETIFDQKIFEENLRKLTELGISFSLDDYGTGYSNIRRIVQLPIEIVKMDKSFVDEYQNIQMQSIIKNTVKMLKEINKKIVVEGIETKESLENFSDLECDYVQGYYFSKPLDQISFISKVLEMNK